MKEHLKKYFPERYEPSSTAEGLFAKSMELLTNDTSYRYGGQKMRCEKMVMDVYENSVCERCKNCSGGFDPDTKQIVICSNTQPTKNKILSTLMHEMIHMFDYCRAEFNFDNLEHVACSEIRAANLTYCSLTDRLQFGDTNIFNFKKSHGLCVKDVAFHSVKSYSPETSDEEIWNIIDKVFPACYNDMEPFGRRPLSGPSGLRQSYRERFLYGYV